jgi:hypothetical protein
MTKDLEAALHAQATQVRPRADLPDVHQRVRRVRRARTRGRIAAGVAAAFALAGSAAVVGRDRPADEQAPIGTAPAVTTSAVPPTSRAPVATTIPADDLAWSTTAQRWLGTITEPLSSSISPRSGPGQLTLDLAIGPTPRERCIRLSIDAKGYVGCVAAAAPLVPDDSWWVDHDGRTYWVGAVGTDVADTEMEGATVVLSVATSTTTYVVAVFEGTAPERVSLAVRYRRGSDAAQDQPDGASFSMPATEAGRRLTEATTAGSVGGRIAGVRFDLQTAAGPDGTTWSVVWGAQGGRAWGGSVLPGAVLIRLDDEVSVGLLTVQVDQVLEEGTRATLRFADGSIQSLTLLTCDGCTGSVALVIEDPSGGGRLPEPTALLIGSDSYPVTLAPG